MGTSSSSISCPANDGSNYTSSGEIFRVACFNDSMYSDINSQGAIKATSLESCIASCVSTPSCIDVSYIPISSQCWLKNAVNSGTHNGYVWGARLIGGAASITSSTSMSTSIVPTATSASSASSTVSSAPTQTCDNRKQVTNNAFGSGLAPWVFTGADNATSYAVTNSPPGIAPLGTSYFLFNSTGQNRNMVTQSICGLYNNGQYEVIVRFTFVGADSQNSAGVVYDLQILVNGTNAQSLLMNPSQVAPDEFYSSSVLFSDTGPVLDLGVSWGVAEGEGRGENVWAALEISNVALIPEFNQE